MKHIERIIGKIILIQVIFLIIAQIIVLHTAYTPYVSKLVNYEGVVKQNMPEVIETIESAF